MNFYSTQHVQNGLWLEEIQLRPETNNEMNCISHSWEVGQNRVQGDKLNYIYVSYMC